MLSFKNFDLCLKVHVSLCVHCYAFKRMLLLLPMGIEVTCAQALRQLRVLLLLRVSQCKLLEMFAFEHESYGAIVNVGSNLIVLMLAATECVICVWRTRAPPSNGAPPSIGAQRPHVSWRQFRVLIYGLFPSPRVERARKRVAIY
jgi:hypothetical protein